MFIKEDGVTLVEVMISASILALIILGTLSTIVSTHSLNIVSKEMVIAHHTLQQQLEQAKYRILKSIAADKIEDIYNFYGDKNNPHKFEVKTLNKINGESVGKIFIIWDETNSDGWLGTPLDLDMDGNFDRTNFSSSAKYLIFPIRASLKYKSANGQVFTYSLMTTVVPSELED